MDIPTETEAKEQNAIVEIKPSDEVTSIEQTGMKDETLSNGTSAGKTKSLYTVRKTTALGMLDVALLTANANQLRFLVTYNTKSPTYYFSLILVIVSLVLQVGVGMALIIQRRMKNTGHSQHMEKMNTLLTVGIFLITVINVFVASFTVTTLPDIAPA